MTLWIRLLLVAVMGSAAGCSTKQETFSNVSDTWPPAEAPADSPHAVPDPAELAPSRR